MCIIRRCRARQPAYALFVSHCSPLLLGSPHFMYDSKIRTQPNISAATMETPDFTPNPDVYTFESHVVGSRYGSAEHLVKGPGVVQVTSLKISSEDCHDCKHVKNGQRAQGFKIVSVKPPNIVEIQVYDQRFDTTTDALGASWAGRSILFRHWCWIRLLQTGFSQNKRSFRLINVKTGYIIGGSCCRHATLMSECELEGCWEGGILLAENHGGWKRVIKHIWTHFTRILWMKFGRHLLKLVSPHQGERHGIMYTPPNDRVL
ncbi:hypothetical protein BGZ60DRAFT_403765 [Tricladium varicosporioides]|nr:hypothetical protein BGZ60DRAFT_403765 [Hymenoscyphus varicosporioides]